MKRAFGVALLVSAFGVAVAQAQPMPLTNGYYAGVAPVVMAQPQPQTQVVYRRQSDMGGGFIEALFGGGKSGPRYEADIQQQVIQQPVMQQPVMQEQALIQPALQQPMTQTAMVAPGAAYANADPGIGGPARPAIDPRYQRQFVDYVGPERPGTLIIDTPQRFLLMVQPGGKAIRYGIGVGRPGFTWAGVKQVSAKREWPDWRPPKEMLQRRPDLPHYMAGGPNNPLGARAMYLGSSLYRIHGSNEPWTIGHAVSSGCIRMRNEDVIDLYGRVKVGTRVVVI